jgi:hypothetical protein
MTDIEKLIELIMARTTTVAWVGFARDFNYFVILYGRAVSDDDVAVAKRCVCDVYPKAINLDVIRARVRLEDLS